MSGVWVCLCENVSVCVLEGRAVVGVTVVRMCDMAAVTCIKAGVCRVAVLSTRPDRTDVLF